MNSNLINPREIRKFGVFGCIFFGTLVGAAVWREKTLTAYFFGILAFLSIGFILIPLQLKQVYAAWLKLTHFIGSKVTILMLTILFYFVITPAALLKKMFGGHPLPLKGDPDAETYWVTRPEPAQPQERFPKRY